MCYDDVTIELHVFCQCLLWNYMCYDIVYYLNICVLTMPNIELHMFCQCLYCGITHVMTMSTIELHVFCQCLLWNYTCYDNVYY